MVAWAYKQDLRHDIFSLSCLMLNKTNKYSREFGLKPTLHNKFVGMTKAYQMDDDLSLFSSGRKRYTRLRNEIGLF